MYPISRGVIVTTLLLALLWPVPSLAGDTGASNADTKRIVVDDVGFATPESVEYYAAEDVYLVTNINGSPIDADGNGFISKIKPDGSVVKLKWIDGTKEGVLLNAPKGAAVQGNALYVADLNYVHIFELPSGKQRTSVDIEGSTFLNGITPGADDCVYVTDTGLKAGGNGVTLSGTDAVYKVWANGKYETIAEDINMGCPNGIVADGNEIMVVTFSSGEVFRIDAAGKRHGMPAPPKGRFDGFVKTNDGRFLISSWGASAIYVMNEDDTFSVLADSLDSPADLGYDAKRNRVLVPLFRQNKVVFLSL